MERQTRSLLMAVGFASMATGMLAACDHPSTRVTDDLQFELFQAHLHTPYVVGAKMTIMVTHGGDSVVGWKVESTDSSVISVGQEKPYEDRNTLYVPIEAVSPGTADLRILNNADKLVTTRTVQVEAPDRIELVHAGLKKIMKQDAPVLTGGDTVQILIRGTGTFEVLYYHEGHRVFGNGVLEPVSSSEDLTATAKTTFLFENREWLALSPNRLAETNSVDLMVGGVRLGRISVESVDATAIARVEIDAESTDGLKKDDTFYLMARTLDDQDRDIFGVDAFWSVDNVKQAGEGDLFEATYDSGKTATVVAQVGEVQDSVEVHTSGGTVQTSNTIGCSTVPVTGAWPLFLALLGMAIMARRRRRQTVRR